jgi:very-short-patch-repair endonuclease
MRHDPTDGEAAAWRVLRDRRTGAKFRRQHRLGAFIADFYCTSLRLAIEIDGEPHLSDDARRRDAERTRILGSMGIRVERFSNRHVVARPDMFRRRVLTVIEERREEIAKMRIRVVDLRKM